MFRLTARFDVNLQGDGLLFKRPRFDDLSYKTTIREFDVKLCLGLSTDLPAYYQKIKSSSHIPKEYTDENWVWATSKVQIHLARDEDTNVPMPHIIDGRKNYEERNRYFENLKPAYQQAAWEVLDRAVRFFKYHLHNPNLSLVNQCNSNFQNPVWIDESGTENQTARGHPTLKGWGMLRAARPG
ncbi:MAG: hypothetical protein QG575_873 [Euryarchaeota archaeon]|nr:hypothetical protein [Euryarchaeota archaeon]